MQQESVQLESVQLESVQRRAARFILNKPWNNNLDSVTVMLNDLKWPTLQSHHIVIILD